MASFLAEVRAQAGRCVRKQDRELTRDQIDAVRERLTFYAAKASKDAASLTSEQLDELCRLATLKQKVRSART